MTGSTKVWLLGFLLALSWLITDRVMGTQGFMGLPFDYIMLLVFGAGFWTGE